MDNSTEPVVEPTVVEETPFLEEEKVEEVAAEAVVDRSAYNCPDCAGEGLKDEQTLCPRCEGTGKI